MYINKLNFSGDKFKVLSIGKKFKAQVLNRENLVWQQHV